MLYLVTLIIFILLVAAGFERKELEEIVGSLLLAVAAVWLYLKFFELLSII